LPDGVCVDAMPATAATKLRRKTAAYNLIMSHTYRCRGIQTCMLTLQTDTRACTHTHAYARAHTHAHTHAYAYAYAHTHTCTHTHTHTYTHTHTHIHTHTHLCRGDAAAAGQAVVQRDLDRVAHLRAYTTCGRAWCACWCQNACKVGQKKNKENYTVNTAPLFTQ
jgi:hypothetical protein